MNKAPVKLFTACS